MAAGKLEGKPGMALHVDFQTEGRLNVPERVATTIFLVGTAKGLKEKGLRLASFVIYLDKKTYRQDPGYFELPTALGTSAVFRYTVVKLWEEDPRSILELGIKSVERIQRAPEAVASAETKRELLLVLAALASIVIEDKVLIRSLCSEVKVLGSNYAIEFFQEEALARGRLEGEAKGEARGETKGEARGTRSGLLEALDSFLSSRFGPVPPELRERMNAVRETDDLKKLVPLAATCADLASFRAALDRG